MKNIIKVLLILVTFLHVLNAEELTTIEKEYLKNNSVKVGMVQDYYPFSYKENGSIFGFSYDYFKLLASKVNLKYEIQINNWSTTLENFKNKKIDIIDSISYTEDRASFTNFTEPHFYIPNVIFTQKNSIKNYKGLESLKGKKVGITKGIYYYKDIEKLDLFELVIFENSRDKIKELAFGKIDAAFNNLTSGQKYIFQGGYTNIEVLDEISDDVIKKEDLRLGVNKENTILYSILQKASQQITTLEKHTLYNKYFGSRKKESKQNLDIGLTQVEKDWIKNNPEVSVALMPDFNPFSYKEGQSVVGFEHDLLSLISKKSGLKFKKQFDIWNKNLKAFENQKVDMITSISYKKERTKFTSYTNPYYEIPIMIFARDDFEGYKDINSLKGKKVGILKDVFYVNDLKKVDGLELVIYETYDEITKALVFGKIDALIQNLTNINHLIKKNAYTNLKLVGELNLPGIKKEDLRFGINANKPILKDIIQKSLDAIDADEYMQLTQRWLEVKQENFDETTQFSKLVLNEEEKAFIRSHPVIKVHNESDWPPFNFAENGEALGYSIDVMNLIANKTGLQIEYITGPSWNDFLEMMKDKSLDVMLNIVKTPERQKYLLFTPPYADNPNAIISKKERPYESIEELFGKTVALPKGFFTEEILKKNYPQIKLLLVEDLLESMKAVSFGKADAALGELAVFNHLSTENMMSDLTVSGEAKMGNPEYSLLNIATRKDLPLLQSILIKGVQSLTLNEKKEIQQKWLGEVEINQSNTMLLDEDEKRYLSSKSDIKICATPDRLPLENIDKEGQYQGIAFDMAKRVSEKINKPVTFVNAKSWLQTVMNFKDKKCDILQIAAKTPSRQEFMDFSKPYIVKPLVVATMEDKFFIQDGSALLGKKIGIVNADASIELLKQKYPQMNIIAVKNAFDGLKRVQSGELFGFVDILPTIAYSIQKEGLLDLKIAGRLEFDMEYSIASQNDQPLLKSIMQKVLDDIPNEQIDSILGKWISIKVQQAFDYKTLIYTVVIFLIVLALIMSRQFYIKKMNKKLENYNNLLLEAQKENEKQNKFITKLLQSIPIPIFYKNKDGVYFNINDKFTELLGIDTDEIVGKSVHDIAPKGLADKYKQKDDELLDDPKGVQIYESKVKNSKNDNILDVVFNKSVFYDENNKPLGIIGAIIDITESKRDKQKIEDYTSKLELKNRELEKISTTDALTGIFNRRYFNEVFPNVINSAKRDDSLVSFLIMDIDHFKLYNDSFGHQMGDLVLVKVARAIKESLQRAGDYCFRLGGEEFGVIFQADSKEKAIKFADKIRKNIESLQIKHSQDSSEKYVTVSIGLVCKNAKEIRNENGFYKQADDLLYKAKDSGRNRVCSI